EGLVNSLGQRRAVDDKAELGVQVHGAGVEVERANEDPLAIHSEGLGVQAGAGAAEGPGAFVAFPMGGETTHLEQLHATLEQIAASFGIAGVYRRHIDRKSTRLNSSHVKISYAVFCLKK